MLDGMANEPAEARLEGVVLFAGDGGEPADGVGSLVQVPPFIDGLTEFSAKVVTATRKRVLHAQRKWTAASLPDFLVTGARPARTATASGLVVVSPGWV